MSTHVHQRAVALSVNPCLQGHAYSHNTPFHAYCRLAQLEAAALQRIMESLDRNIPARHVPLSEDEAPLVRGLQLLTMKPMIYAANVPEGDLADEGGGNPHVQALRKKAEQEGCEVIIVSAQVHAPVLASSLCTLHAAVRSLGACPSAPGCHPAMS